MTCTGPLIATLLAAAGQVPFGPVVGERYYMTLFGTQSVPYQVRYTHTWATFVRTAVTPAGEVPVAVDTVSWMPATLSIRPLALRREPGTNLTLDETFRWVASFGGKVSVWGPYEIDLDRYDRFLARRGQLESGEVLYRALGAFTRRGAPVSNCGQSFARSSPIVGRRYLQPTPRPGENGTSRLAWRYGRSGTLLGDSATHDWLLHVIGAARYPITVRKPGEFVPFFGP